MCEKHIVIIGSGLGGLACGVILAKNGYRVTIFEKESQAGGCLQCFKRDGVKFETGMHFVGSASQGQTLGKLMRYLGLDGRVRLSMLNQDGYDVISFRGQRYKFAMGREAFISQMTEYFPFQRQNLKKYFDLVENVSRASSLHSLKYADTGGMINMEFQLRSIDEVIDSVVSDPLLAEVLVGTLPLYAAKKGKAPFSEHAFIMDFYNKSAYRFVGGCDVVADVLVKVIEELGGSVRLRSCVDKILCDDTHAVAIELKSGERISCDYVISDAHPLRTLEMLNTSLIRPAFRRRVEAIPQTVGGFTVYLKYKPNAVPYMNYNFYGYNGDNIWGCENYDEATWPKGYLYMHFCHEPQPRFAESGVLLSYMNFADVAQWKDSFVGHRGKEYELFKKEKAEQLIGALQREFPNIRQCIETYYTSTPLTYRDYTGTEDGSMYGIVKDINNISAYRISHRTKIRNVLLTGQNINSHGMLGVLVGSIVTCGELLSSKLIFQQIMEANR
ncbi:MAG: NAD(P)/FAD-dependent oxidoreductase [Prevotellaceae bacterium]|nr:NAD(P)/FAD-dependent oxidoreductase [Prevotellaceae bacterium]